MGGLMHLFDFNQALSGRKLLTNKKSGTGLDVLGNGLDIQGNVSETTPKSEKQRSDEDVHQTRKSSSQKKTNGMPIKALIARDLTKGSSDRSKSPSVVARLMGLEALPSDSKSLPKTASGNIMRNIDEKPVYKSSIDKQHQDDKLNHSGRLHTKKDRQSLVSGQLSSRSLRLQQSDTEDDRPGFGSLPYRNHPQEEQLQEFKKEFEAWQNQKLLGHPKRSAKYTDSDPQLSSRHVFPYERQQKVKPAMVKEKNSSSRTSDSQERLQESREFQDAMEFLQSNKEFFMKFIHQSDSLFARHLRDNDDDTILPPHEIHVVKPKRIHKTPEDTPDGYRSQSWARESPGSRESTMSRMSPTARMNYRSDIYRSTSEGVLPDFNNLSQFEGSVEFNDRHKHSIPPVEHEKRSHAADYQVPTRIVVLKPSPGRTRNLKSPSSTYSRSPRDINFSKEASREDNVDVLERLREKLRKDSGQEKRGNRLNMDSHYKDALKDPREIAREIARQVRENVTRDMMAGSVHSSNKRYTGNDKNPTRRNKQVSEILDSPGNTDSEVSPHPSRLYWETYHRPRNMISLKDKTIGMESVSGSREVRKDGLAQSKARFEKYSSDLMLQLDDSQIKNLNYFENSSRELSPEQNNSASPQGSGRHSPDVGQKYRRALFHSPTRYDDEDTEAFNDQMSYDETVEAMPQSTDITSESAFTVSFDPEYRQPESGAVYSHGGEPLCTDSEIISTSSSDSVRQIDLEQQSVDHLAGQVEVVQQSADLIAGQSEVLQQCDNAKENSTVEVNQAFRENECSNSCENENACISSECLCEPLTPASPSPPRVTVLDVSEKPDCQSEEINSDIQPVDVSTPSSQHDACSNGSSQNFLAHVGNTSSAVNDREPIKEQSEQPSPVSVLDFAFQEDSSIPNELQEINADLQELRKRLRLLNFDGCDENYEHDSKLEDVEHEEVPCVAEEDIGQEDPDLESEKIIDFLVNTEELNCVCCPPEKELDLSYVKHLLAASGCIGGDSSVVLSKWYAPNQPLNPSLFQRIELGHIAKNFSAICNDTGVLGRTHRHLIFDTVNEVLCHVLGPYLNRRLWLLSLHELTVFPMPSGSDLLKSVWSQVSALLDSHYASQDTLENLVTKDLNKGGSWFNMGVEMEAVCLDIERSILEDLIEETLLVF